MSTARTIEVGQAHASVPDLLQEFRHLFNTMGSGNLGDLARVYSEEVVFTDPFASVRGLDNLTKYLGNSYQNVISCRFDFEPAVVEGQRVAIPWVMYLKHKRLKGGEEVSVDGLSLLTITGNRVSAHRDYFDAGELLYENLPVLGRMVKWIRGHAA